MWGKSHQKKQLIEGFHVAVESLSLKSNDDIIFCTDIV
jgi:hypothetical protein